MQQCIAPRVLYEHEVVLNENSTDNNSLTTEPYDRCVLGTISVCRGNAAAGGMSLFYIQNKSSDLILPDTKLYYDDYISEDQKLCPAPKPPYVNETDNMLLCMKGVGASPEFPSRGDGEGLETIPIFWSGSASYKTLLKVDFYDDRFAVNVITVLEGMEGKCYVDTHELPNAVYPYHE